MSKEHKHSMDRRDFMKTSAAATIAGAAAFSANPVGPNRVLANDGMDHRNERPDKMTYRKLGRTNFMCSRLVFGCGAALMQGKAVRLLEQAYENGVNHFDVGYDTYYKGSEKYLADFLKDHRDDVWVTSKAAYAGWTGLSNEKFTVEKAKEAAGFWSMEMDRSLERMGIDYVDAYYLMAIGDEQYMYADEVIAAFHKAKEAGKVGHFGISTHKRADKCLEAAIETGEYSLAMIAITPGGWYDWDSKQLLEGTSNLQDLQPLLKRARGAGIGLVGMKAARFIAPATALGKGDSTALDSFYDEKLMSAPLSPFQRSYAYVLENGIDVMNSDMQNFKHFEENVVAARTSHEYFA